MKPFLTTAIAMAISGLLVTNPAAAADASFAFKTAYRNVTADPEGIWSGDALSGGNVSIFEYELRTGAGDLLISQIWNEECASSTCPTRLVRRGAGGANTVLVDDMMRQVIPPNDPRFANLPKTGPQAEFAESPFRLSADGKTLLNGDFKFQLDGARP